MQGNPSLARGCGILAALSNGTFDVKVVFLLKVAQQRTNQRCPSKDVSHKIRDDRDPLPLPRARRRSRRPRSHSTRRTDSNGFPKRTGGTRSTACRQETPKIAC